MTYLAARAPVQDQAPLYYRAREPARPWPEGKDICRSSRTGCRRVSGDTADFLFSPEPTAIGGLAPRDREVISSAFRAGTVARTGSPPPVQSNSSAAPVSSSR